MAQRHSEITAAGGRLAGIVIDSPQQNAAMVQKLDLPFPILSDPDRTLAIDPYGVADPNDKRNIARPTFVLISPEGTEVFRAESRDFADRITEDDLIGSLTALGLAPTNQPPPETGPAEPGPAAMPFDGLMPYFRGARFAVVALSGRHDGFAEDATAYIEEMDRYAEALKAVYRRRRHG